MIQLLMLLCDKIKINKNAVHTVYLHNEGDELSFFKDYIIHSHVILMNTYI